MKRKFLAILLSCVLVISNFTIVNKGLCIAAAEENHQVKELDTEQVNFDSSYNRIVFNEKNDGIYFLQTEGPTASNVQSYKIIFYDLKKDSYREIYKVPASVEKIYVGNDTVYFARADMERESVTVGDSTEYQYNAIVTVYSFDMNTQKDSTIKLDPFATTGNWFGYIAGIGVDGKGRYYVSTQDDELNLFDSAGKFLTKKVYSGYIGEFYGFDETNGNFYYKGDYNWKYWGYDHHMSSMMAGNVGADNTINLPEKNLMILYQSGFFNLNNPVELIAGKYLAVCSQFQRDTLVVLDSNSYDYNDYTESQTSIDILSGSVSVSLLNIKNTDIVKFRGSTAASDIGSEGRDLSSQGSRCAMVWSSDNLLVKTGANEITEYTLADSKKMLVHETAHPVYDFEVINDNLVVVEKEDDKLYVEIKSTGLPEDYNVDIPSGMSVGEIAQIKCTAEDGKRLDYIYNSSDPKIVSVSKNGLLSAWKSGTATITVTAPSINKTYTFDVMVTGVDMSSNAGRVVVSNGLESTNIHLPKNTGRYGSIVNSYLYAAGTRYQRVEYVNDKVVVESYDKDYALQSQKYIEKELPIFGGAFSGETYNFLVFGQGNAEESDAVEVIRVVKYDKNWERLGDCKIYGANTYIPFDAGSLSMTEAGGILYVHTCHTMYKSGGTVNHQANCTFAVKQDDMVLKDSYYNVMNLSTGYVSHSFMQLIKTDGEYLYRADLGDAYPRGIALTKTSLEKKLSEPSMAGAVVPIEGSIMSNYTGYSLGGLELSDHSYIIAGAGIKTSDDRCSNIFINSSPKDSWTTEVKWITDNTSVNISVGVPKLVKINNNQFLIMWEEYNSETKAYSTKMANVAADGSICSEIYTATAELSDCQPIVNSKGNVVWYVTNGSKPVFVEISPFRLEEAAAEITRLKKEIEGDNAAGSNNAAESDNAAEDDNAAENSNTGSTSATVKNPVKTVKVSLKGIKGGKKSLTITWKKAKNVRGYQVQVATDKKFKKNKKTKTIKNNKTKKIVLKNLKQKRKYYVRIRAYTVVNGKKYYSGWSKVKTQKTK